MVDPLGGRRMTTTNLSQARADALSEVAAQLSAAVNDLAERRRAAHADAQHAQQLADKARAELTRRGGDHGPDYSWAPPRGTLMHDVAPDAPVIALEAEADRHRERARRLDEEYRRLLPRWTHAARLAERCQSFLMEHRR